MKRVVLIGQPNSGKSTFFSQISGALVHTSNFPGTTVSISKAVVRAGGKEYEVIDLPGTYALFPSDEAERVTLEFLMNHHVDIIVNVMDASLIWRSLELTLELAELGKPMILVLNMMDEAERKGIKIDVARLEEILGIKVVPCVAIHGKGIYEAIRALREARPPRKPLFSRHVEEIIKRIEEKTGSRFRAIKMIEGAIPPERGIKKFIQKAAGELEAAHGRPAFEVIASERHHLSMKIAEQVTRRAVRGGRSLEEKLDRFLLHPVGGYFFLGLTFLLIFLTVFVVGSWLEDIVVDPLESLSLWVTSRVPNGFLRHLLQGLFMGIIGGAGVVIPYFLPLITLISFFEDLGYLSRVAFLMDVFMHRIGLHGKSVVPFILGYGCTVPALMATRILENRRDRILSALLIPFIPCSARTTVVLAVVAYYLGIKYVFIIYFTNLLVIGAVGKLTSLFMKAPSPELLIEVPAYKLPSPAVVAKKVLYQLEEFVFRAWPILIAGSIILAAAQYVGFDSTFNTLLSPLTSGLLQLPSSLGVTLVFGFLRKELTLLMAAQALGVKINELNLALSSTQLFVFTTFIVYYIPCLSSVVVMAKEFGWKVTLASSLLSFAVATLLAGSLALIL